MRDKAWGWPCLMRVLNECLVMKAISWGVCLDDFCQRLRVSMVSWGSSLEMSFKWLATERVT